jgi:uncharacterized membrane protein YedE/YeeE
MLNGRIAGICGIFGGALNPRRGETMWRWLFILGLVAGGAIMVALRPSSITAIAAQPIWLAVVAGVLVGFGARLGAGCTSGHGVCGISRFSKRSIVATMVFMGSAAATVFVARHLMGASW